VGSPEPVLVLPVIVERQRLEVITVEIEIIDTHDSILFRVVPRNQPRVAGVRVTRSSFDNEALEQIARFIEQPLVGVFLKLLAGNVFIGEFTANEGAGFIGRLSRGSSNTTRDLSP
jgi:hypothetical protein